MRFHLLSKLTTLSPTDTLIIAVKESGELLDSAHLLNSQTSKSIKKAIEINQFKGKKNKSLCLYLDDSKCSLRVILIGIGKTKTFSSVSDYKELITHSIKIAEQAESQSIISLLTCLSVQDCSISDLCFHASEAAQSTHYSFTELKSEKIQSDLTKITWMVPNKKEEKNAQLALNIAEAIGLGKTTAQDLANLPGNICTPAYMAQAAQKLTKRYSTITCNVINTAEIKKLKMGAFLSVAKGSEHPPKLIIIKYKGHSTKKAQAPIALVGKGITFDTGGISLKPSDAMVGMKYDMCGAASVIGTIEALAKLKAKQSVIGVLACAENMPSHNASKPDDVVTSMSGQTIEIANTDAEGRLVLCDALTYCARFKPRYVIDIATLTGAVVVALGSIPSGLYSNDQSLAKKLLEAGQKTHDRAWQMPLWEDYQALLESPVADVCNIGGREAGSVTAACFLARFTKKFQWAHLDVAGSAFRTGKHAAASGRPVPLLTQFILNCAS